MKKIGILIVLILVVVGGYFGYQKYLESKIPKIEIEEIRGEVNEYYVYGTYMNMNGKITISSDNYTNFDLIFFRKSDGEISSFELLSSKEDGVITFNISEYVNRGIKLQGYSNDDYLMFLRTTYVDEEENESYKYYALDNKTEYNNTEYYSISSDNKKIVINSSNSYNTMMLDVNDSVNNSNVYDIVIDPGHGGIDGGAAVGDYVEADIVIDIASKLKEKLESEGLKVKLTREEGSLGEGEYFQEYGKGGRAVIPYEVKAKYLISLHLNSLDTRSVKGMELYTPSGIDYTFAESLVKNITDNVGITTSTNRTHKVKDGIYTHNFSESEIENAYNNYDNKGYNRYEITTKSNYLYMIRETGGIVTGAYVDDRNPKVGANPYYDSNIGTEAYLLEMGYLTNNTDRDILLNNQDAYVSAISSAIMEQINNK